MSITLLVLGSIDSTVVDSRESVDPFEIYTISCTRPAAVIIMQTIFDDKAKRVIRASGHIAKANGLKVVVPDCIFDGLLVTGVGKASSALRTSDVSAFLPFGAAGADLNTVERIPFSEDSRRLMHLSMAAARELNDGRVDTEHLLLGYVRLYDGKKEVPRRRIVTDAGSISVPTTGVILNEEAMMKSMFGGTAWQIGDKAGTQIGRNDELAMVISRLFSHNSEAMVLTDRNGVILEANDAYFSLYGYSRDEVIGKTQSIVKSDLTPKETYDEMWRDILDLNIGNWKGEIINRKKNGENVPILLLITSVQTRLSEASHFLSTSLDLTEQNKLIYERDESHAKFAHMGRMTAAIAHDLRTPLTAIRLASWLARENPELSEEMNGLITQISKQCDKLTAMTIEITDLASGNITLNCEDLKLSSFIVEFIEEAKGRQYLAGVSLECTLGYSGSIAMDGDRMHRVLENLVKNAGLALGESKNASKKIWITSKDDGDSVILEVNDNGPGVPHKIEPNLFKFSVTSKREAASSGIGLYSALQTVSTHGGEIHYNRKDGISTFSIRLPKRRDAAKAER